MKPSTRALCAIALLQLAVVPARAAEPQPGRLYYDDGVTFETDEFDLKLNILLQPRYTYEDIDEGGRDDLDIIQPGARGDINSFDLRRARIYFTGNALRKAFSFMLEQELAEDQGGGELQDAWVQWNSDAALLRLGQTRIPFSRQERASNAALQFTERSVTSDYFAPKRQIGVMLHGPLGDSLHYYFGAFNGESTIDGVSEGQNRPGIDNKLLFAAALDAVFGDYGSRAVEGDLRKNRGTFGATAGVAVIYGEGRTGTGTAFDVDPESGLASFGDDDFERFGLDGDVGLRYAGLSFQAEAFYTHDELSEGAGPLSADGLSFLDSVDDFGFYVQAGWLLREDLEIAFRYGYLDQDEDRFDPQTVDEFATVVNYFIDGHRLKVQTAFTWLDTSYDANEAAALAGGDTTDFIVESQISAEF